MEKIKIPMRFKERLLARWDINNIEKDDGFYGIKIECILCKEHKQFENGWFELHYCETCPFYCNELICTSFIKRISPKLYNLIDIKFESIGWSAENDQKVRRLLSRFVKKALKYIEWEGKNGRNKRKILLDYTTRGR